MLARPLNTSSSSRQANDVEPSSSSESGVQPASLIIFRISAQPIASLSATVDMLAKLSALLLPLSPPHGQALI